MYAKAPIRGTAERESGPSFKTPLRVHFYARRLPTPHEVGSIGLYKRPTSRLGEDGYPKARGILKGIPAWVPSRGPLGGSPRGIVTSQMGARLERPILRVRSTTPGGPPRVHTFTPTTPKISVEGVFSLGCYDNAS